MDGSASDLSGTVGGHNLTLAGESWPCSRNFALSAKVALSNRTMIGSIGGENCDGDVSATFSATKS